MSSNTYANDIDTIHQIDYIEFTLLSNEEILRISALGHDTNGIETLELYDSSEPKQGSLIDPRMGTIGYDYMCASCGLCMDCPGHSGHICLSERVFHV